jgi:hypothetical protein
VCHRGCNDGRRCRGASVFSVHHPNFNSGSLDGVDFICGSFLSRGLHVYMLDLGVFYRNIDFEHHHVFPSDVVYKQLTHTCYLVKRLEQQVDIVDAPVFKFSLPNNCPAAVKHGDLVHLFTENNMAGSIIDCQVSSTDTAALFLVCSYWDLRASPFHVSGWFHVRVLACFALVLGHTTDSQRNHCYVTNKPEGEQPKSYPGFYSKHSRLAQ